MLKSTTIKDYTTITHTIMFEAFCFLFGAIFLAIAGQTMIDGIARKDIKLKLNSWFTLLISGIWMILGTIIS